MCWSKIFQTLTRDFASCSGRLRSLAIRRNSHGFAAIRVATIIHWTIHRWRVGSVRRCSNTTPKHQNFCTSKRSQSSSTTRSANKVRNPKWRSDASEFERPTRQPRSRVILRAARNETGERSGVSHPVPRFCTDKLTHAARQSGAIDSDPEHCRDSCGMRHRDLPGPEAHCASDAPAARLAILQRRSQTTRGALT